MHNYGYKVSMDSLMSLILPIKSGGIEKKGKIPWHDKNKIVINRHRQIHGHI